MDPKNKLAASAGRMPALLRRFRHSTYLDFAAPQACALCGGRLEVKDHRAPWFSPPYTASPEWRYEVTCETCYWCDCNGYANRREVLAAYPLNATVHPVGREGQPDTPPTL